MNKQNRSMGRLFGLIAGLAVIAALYFSKAFGGTPPLGPVPPLHPSCGEAPLLVLNEDTGELFWAVSMTYHHSAGPGTIKMLSFRDGRVFCNGYED